jgi:iron complex transport system substrate-binding protein
MTTRATLFTVCLLLASLCVGGIGAATAAAPSATSGAGSMDAAQSDCSFPVERTDTTGETVRIDSEPDRLVVLQPSDAQLAWEVGAQDRVVGMARTQYTSYLDGRSGKTNIKNDDGTVNIEQVVGLQPDLVIASNTTDPATVRELRRAGLTVYHFGLVTSLDEIARNVETVGSLVGECETATEQANEFRLDVRTVERSAELADERPTVLYYFFGYTAGSETHIHDVIETAGGENVAATVGIKSYAELSPEVAVEEDPDWILYPGHASAPDSAAYNETTAIRQGQTMELNEDFISQPGPRVAIPLTQLAKQWHPEELARANESVTMANVTTPNESTTTGSSSSGPGFGFAVAAASLLATALLARRD